MSREFKNLPTRSIFGSLFMRLVAMTAQNIESNSSTGASIYHLLYSCVVFCKKTPSYGEFKFKWQSRLFFYFFIFLGLVCTLRLNLKRTIMFSSKGRVQSCISYQLQSKRGCSAFYANYDILCYCALQQWMICLQRQNIITPLTYAPKASLDIIFGVFTSPRGQEKGMKHLVKQF